MKKMITLICCVLSVSFLFAGCAADVNLTEEQSAQINSNVQTILTEVVSADYPDMGNMTAYTEADREAQLNLSSRDWEELQLKWENNNNLYIENHSVYTQAITSYVSSEEENGMIHSVNETFEYAIVDKKLSVTVTLRTSAREVEMVLLYDDEMNITGIAFNPVYTVGENMTKAVLNTAMGMGTVFAVLILIMFIISGFKIIYNIQNAGAKKKTSKEIKEEAVDQTIAQIIEKEELSDDLELVAVISAAIAAYEGSASTEGFVVRSIRKQKKDGWKRAL